jgi:autotransporter-associated beta strand protein
MKTKLLAAALIIFVTASAHAATLYWDPGKTVGTSGGGNGNWLDADVWYDAVANANVSWAAGSDAVFGGTAGRIQLNGANNATVSAGVLTFNTPGYIIDIAASSASATAAMNFTITGLAGQPANLRNSSTLGSSPIRTLTINLAADTAWGGTLGKDGNGRMSITLNGGKRLTMTDQLLIASNWGQPWLSLNNGSRLILVGNTSSGASGSRVGVYGGSFLDVGDNSFSTRQFAMSDAGSEATSSGSGRITVNTSWDQLSNPFGTALSGTLAITIGGGRGLTDTTGTMAGNNTYSGGTIVVLNSGFINVTHNAGLGTGPVKMENGGGTARINFRTAAPAIGSLSSANVGTKQIVLGDTGVDTTLTVNQTADTTFAGVVSDFSGRTGSLTKTGANTLILSGANTYTGTTRVENGTLRVTHATAGLGSGKVQVAGGTFAGPASSGTGAVTFRLGTTPDGFVMTSGTLDLSRLALSFSGTPNLTSYTLVDYSAGGTFVGAANAGTLNTFASVANVPAGYKWLHDTAAKQVLLYLPPAGTVLSIR